MAWKHITDLEKKHYGMLFMLSDIRKYLQRILSIRACRVPEAHLPKAWTFFLKHFREGQNALTLVLEVLHKQLDLPEVIYLTTRTLH